MAALELRQTYDFLTQLHDEFEPLHAQLLARCPSVSLMDVLAEVCNEETHRQDAGLLRVSSVLAPRPPVAPSAAHGASIGLHCDHCDRDGHVETFCYRKKKAQKAQTRYSSQGTGSSSSERSERSFAGSEIQELLMLLHRLAASTSSGVVGSVTQSSAVIDPATASQSSTLGPPSAPSPGTYPWYLDSDASFHMTPHSAYLSLRPSYRYCTVHITDGSPLSISRQGTLSSDSFYVLDVSLVPDLTM
jgi:hypothetical protein